MRSPIHKEGFFFGLVFLLTAYLISKVSNILSKIFYLLFAFSLYFFRDPHRDIPEGDNIIVSPADGKVVGIDSVEYCPFLNAPAKRISIFLSIFDIHINRAPIAGKISFREYMPGAFLPAFEPKASIENEQNSIGIETPDGYKILVKQIAGIIARRILCWNNPGDNLKKGERFGLIRFGSRTDLFLSLDTTIEIKLGDKVSGGSTIIAKRK